jgi:hypothetical protein
MRSDWIEDAREMVVLLGNRDLYPEFLDDEEDSSDDFDDDEFDDDEVPDGFDFDGDEAEMAQAAAKLCHLLPPHLRKQFDQFASGKMPPEEMFQFLSSFMGGNRSDEE